MSGEELAAPLGPLPPVKIHCAQLVEGALRSALQAESAAPKTTPAEPNSPTLLQSFSPGHSERKLKIVLDP
jgi:nitrogen fixation NifU-like protein